MGGLFEKYGSMILEKGTVLYHTSDSSDFEEDSNNKPFLFCTFHPSEWSGYSYVHFIQLQKDIRLLFMVKDIINDQIISALPDIVDDPRENLAKMPTSYPCRSRSLLSFREPSELNDVILSEISVDLEKEYFHGWFTSIQNKATVEVALMSGKNIYEHIKSEPLKRAWRNGNCTDDGEIFCKIWRKRYILSFIEKGIKLRVHKRFKKLFRKYKLYEQKSKYINEYVFQIILDHANIKFLHSLE